ncbi:MAG: tetratricopeptide repeat protein [Rhodospirillaceae bacterium]|nr:tetratricopeptide repeat protein [Rhodospirillaceae bacterium]MBT6117289.1 tetratricopeptide repeat protein [Rhodospirillaceae bacterium]
MTRTAVLLAFLGTLGLGVSALPGASLAQSDLSNRLDRLERDMTVVQRQLYNLGGSSGAAPTPTGTQGTAPAPSAAAQMDIRIGDLETALRSLTGRVEQIDHVLRQLDQKVERLASQGPTAAAGPAPLDATPPASGTAPDLTRPTPPGVTPGANATQPPTTVIGGTPPASGNVLPEGTVEEQFRHAFGYLRVGDHANGELAMREFLDLHGDDPAAGNAYYWLGKIYFARGDFQQAAIAYAEGYQKFPEGPKAELTLLNLAQSLGKFGKTAEACASLEQLDVQFPSAGPTVRGEATATRQDLGCS